MVVVWQPPAAATPPVVPFEEMRSMPYVTRAITDVPAQFVWWNIHCQIQQRHSLLDVDFSAPIMWHLDLVSPPLLVRVVPAWLGDVWESLPTPAPRLPFPPPAPGWKGDALDPCVCSTC